MPRGHRGIRLAGAARVGQVHLTQAGLDARIVSRRADVTDHTVGAGFEVADEIVVRKRQQCECRDIGRHDEPENRAQPGAEDHHANDYTVWTIC